MTNFYDVANGLSQDEPGPLEPVEIAQQPGAAPATGNTARDQEMYAAGIRTGEENTKHNAAIRGCAAWLPIESAPKDGTEFQAWLNVGLWEPRCRFNPDSEAFEIWGRVDYDRDDWDACSHLTATHWMPLPAAPGVSTVEDAQDERSATHGMTLGERIAHVGGRTNAQGYVEFGSPMAVNALIQQVLRDIDCTRQDDDGAYQARYRLPGGQWSSWGHVVCGVKGHEQELRYLPGERWPAPAVGDALDLTLAQKYEDACILANANARDAERYRQLRKALTSYDTGWLDRIAAALEAMGLDPDEDKLPTPEQVDGAFDAAQRKGDA